MEALEVKKERVMKIFDYCFYRIYKFYQKRDDTPALYASAIVSLFQFFLVFSIISIGSRLLGSDVPPKFFFFLIILGIIVLNWFRYEKQTPLHGLEELWQNEDQTTKSRRGWLIVVSIVTSILLPFLVGSI